MRRRLRKGGDSINSFMAWVGGKKALRDEILARFPRNYKRYIEVFGGAGWVLFHKPPGNDFEVFNDFNGNLVNLYHCVREQPEALRNELRYIFFANIKRGGILLIQIAVGSLYMFSVPRGYQDGFNQWMKQIAALCLTAFMQTSLLFLGLLTFPGNMLLGLGVMLAANEVPRIAQQFGLDSSVRVNMMSVVHATTTAVNLTRSVARATGK